MASNEHKTAAELEAEIEMQRNRVSDTIDEIQDRLSPGQIVDQLMSYTKGGAGDFAQNMGKSMISNPLPVALLGVSLVWLMSGKSPMDMAGGGRSHQSRSSGSYYPPRYGMAGGDDYSDDYSSTRISGGRGWAEGVGDKLSGVGDTLSDVGDRLSDAGASVGDRLSDAASSAGERLSGAASSAGDRLSSAASAAVDRLSGAASAAGDAMGHAQDALRGAGEQFSSARYAMGDGIGQARERLSGVRENLSHRAHDLRDRTRDMRHQAMDMQGTAVQFLSEQPLVAAALAFAAGAALGASLPVTARENELLGETADQVKARIKEAAEPLVSQAKGVIGDVMEEGKTVLNDTMQQGKSILDDTMKQGKDALGEVQNKLGDVQNKLGESYGHVKETVTEGVSSAISSVGSPDGDNAGAAPDAAKPSSDQSPGYGTTPSGMPGQRW